LSTLPKALRRKTAFSQISAHTIGVVLHEAGFRWVSNRSWCETGPVQRRRKSGVVTVVDPAAAAKKNLIERAYREGETRGLAVWTQDEAGPYQTRPYPGQSWKMASRAARYPHA
jgi:hypothetical protein